jgi:hypothetical protein
MAGNIVGNGFVDAQPVIAVDASGNALTINTLAPTVSAPLQFAGNNLSIPKADTATDGYLSSTDWNKFNLKVDNTSVLPLTEVTVNGIDRLELEATSGPVIIDSASNMTITSQGQIVESGITIEEKSDVYWKASCGANVLEIDNVGITYNGLPIVPPSGEVFSVDSVYPDASGNIVLNALTNDGTSSSPAINRDSFSVNASIYITNNTVGGQTEINTNNGILNATASGINLTANYGMSETINSNGKQVTINSGGWSNTVNGGDVVILNNAGTISLTAGSGIIAGSNILPATSGVGLIGNGLKPFNGMSALNVNTNTVSSFGSTINSASNFSPTTSGTKNLGDSSHPWGTLFVSAISGVSLGNTYTGLTPIVVSGTQISITQASASSDGYLSSGNWTTFNNKLSTIASSGTGQALTNGTAVYTLSGNGIGISYANGVVSLSGSSAWNGGAVTSSITPTSSGTLAVGTPALPFASGNFQNINGNRVANFKMNEPLTGLINGSNKAYTLTNTPTTDGVMLYKNGIYMAPSGINVASIDYVLSGNSITMVSAPLSGSTLIACYPYYV